MQVQGQTLFQENQDDNEKREGMKREREGNNFPDEELSLLIVVNKHLLIFMYSKQFHW